MMFRWLLAASLLVAFSVPVLSGCSGGAAPLPMEQTTEEDLAADADAVVEMPEDDGGAEGADPAESVDP